MKTLRREEIDANEYRDLDYLLDNIAAFIAAYYHYLRLHAGPGYPPEAPLPKVAACVFSGSGDRTRTRRGD